LLLGAFLSLSGCRPAQPEPESAEPISGSLYQIQQGRFTLLSDAGEIRETPFQPWTVQARVSDMTVLGPSVYLGINGHGIAQLTPGESARPEFRYFYDSLIFGYRTLTTLLPQDRPDGPALVCHIYFNKLLNVVAESELKLQGISLLRLDPSRGIYEFLTPPYQEEHPEWEAVGFVPVDPQEFFLEWKYSDRNRTLFSYSRFDLLHQAEEEVEAQSYRRSYGFHDIEESSALRVLLAEARRILDTPDSSTAYQLLIRSQDRSLVTRYEYHPDDFTRAEEIRLYSLSGVRSSEDLYLLLPDGSLLHGSPSSRKVRRLPLPPLPEGYVYRQLMLHDDTLLASWEQNAFTDVGAAGFFFAAPALIP
jgi:hypothetical protein